MDARQVVTEYLLLGLRFGRLGFVDAYTGDPHLRRRVAGEPAPRPAELAASARRLRAALPGSGLSAPRLDFLAAQLTALECSGRLLAGRRMSWRTEAEACFQVRPEPGDVERYRQAHAELAELLPGRGDLAVRLARLRARERVPPEALPRCVRSLAGALRSVVRAACRLPVQESVTFRLVGDRPWSALHRYRGDFRSLVAINGDLAYWGGELPALVAHEAYPGHHTERCRKEDGPREQGIALRNTPESLISEGLADLGLALSVGGGWGPWAADVLAEAGIVIDGELAERVHEVLQELRPVRLDAAVLLRDGHAEADVVAHLRRWALMPEQRAGALVRFLRDPLRRAYTVAYVEGERLVRGWLGDGPGAAERARRLWDEPWTPAALRSRRSRGPGCVPVAQRWLGCSEVDTVGEP